MSAAVRQNVLIKGGRAIEQLARVDAMLFDKTGTLTSGTPSVTHVQPLCHDVSEEDLLMLTAATEYRLSHPAAQAIVAEAQKRGITFPERAASRYFIGSGMEARIDGKTVLVGSENFLLDRGISIPPAAIETAQKSGKAGVSTVFAACDNRTIGFISYADIPRVEAREVLARLRTMGVKHVVMITGDQQEVADAVAGHLDIDHVEAEIFPEHKSAIVRALQARGYTVAVVGDGINDSPALAYADVSLSLTSGTEIARETADIVLHGTLHGIVDAMTLARDVMGIIRQDIAIVGTSNGIGVVLAALGLINPTLATAINNGSGVAAALNSLRPILPKQDYAGKRLSLASPEADPVFVKA
jgi:Cu2+-exporting ATPase